MQLRCAWLSVSVIDRNSVDVVLAPYVGGRFSLKNVFFGGAGLISNVNSYQNGRGKIKAPQGKIFLGIFYLFAGFNGFFSV